MQSCQFKDRAGKKSRVINRVILSGTEKAAPFANAYAMESVGIQYAADELVEGPVNDGRYASPRSGAIYAPENFYDAASGTWYSASGGGGGGGSYGPQSSSHSGNYHNVNHSSHMAQQAASHEHYGMSPHMEAPHMSTTPQPLPPMSSFRGGSTNGPTTSVGPTPTNPALYNPSLAHHAPSHTLQNDTLVGKALQTVSDLSGIFWFVQHISCGPSLYYRCILMNKA